MEMPIHILRNRRGKIIRAAISREPACAKGFLRVTFHPYNHSRGGSFISQMMKRLEVAKAGELQSWDSTPPL